MMFYNTGTALWAWGRVHDLLISGFAVCRAITVRKFRLALANPLKR